MASVTGKILLVDDEVDLTFLLKAHLTTIGYETAVCGNGTESIELARTFQPDLVVMDLKLPGIDGVSATRLLKADPSTRHIPVIMLTSCPDSEFLVAALEAGVEDYVRKPFEVVELLARIRAVHRLARVRHELDVLNNELSRTVASKTHRLQILYDLTRSLNGAGAREEILDLIVRAVQQVTGSERISLMLKADDGEFLRCVRAVGIDPTVVPQIRVRAVDGIVGRVFTSGKTFVASAYGDSEATADRYQSDEFLSTPLMSTSLATGGEIFGVLNVTDKANGDSFTQEEQECIRSIADAGAIALHHDAGRERLRNSVKVLLLTVGRLAEYRDEETADHLHRVSHYARVLATELARIPSFSETISAQYIEDLVQAAPMHDIGKVGIPDEILLKQGKLTDEEFAIMKTHTLIGRQVLEFAQSETGSVPMLQMCIDIAHCHHEKFDGSGYPRRLRGNDIPLAARIISLVDAYDAITSRRPYKEARGHEDAVSTLRQSAGSHFDPDIVATFLNCHADFDVIRRRYAPPGLLNAAVGD